MIEVLAIIAMPVSVAISAVILVRAIRQGIRAGVDKSINDLQKQCRFSELPRLLPCPHGFRSDETCPTCRHFQKVRESE